MVLFQQKFATVDGNPFSGYDVVVCDRCGAGYADRIPPQDALDAYYRNVSKYEYHQRDGAESDYDRKRLATTADLIRSRVSDSALEILDVGCATGRLLAELRERGFGRLTGLDPSPACAAAALRLYNIQVRNMTIAELAAQGEQFDMLLLVGVLEHLREVQRSVSELRALLRPGGLIYLEVPDVVAFADWPNAPFQDFSTEHINFFSTTSLDSVMRAQGFHQVYAERNHCEQSFATTMSNISAIYRVGEPQENYEPAKDLETQQALVRYIEKSTQADTYLQRQIDDIVQSGMPILVWGVGTHTSRLMATSRLREANVVAFIESNAKYHGKTLMDRPILPPADLMTRGESVLVSSRVFQQEIVNQIRYELHCANPLVLLYEVD